MARQTQPKPIDPWVTDLGHPDYKVRQEAVRQLQKTRNPEAVPLLIDALQDTTVGVRRLAIRALGRFKDPRAIRPLIGQLAHPACHVHKTAHEELARIGDAAVPALVAALADPEQRIRRGAALILGELDRKDAAEALLPLLTDPVVEVRRCVLSALETLRVEAAREPLAALLPDPPSESPQAEQTRMALLLARLGDARAIPTLRAAYAARPALAGPVSLALSFVHDPRAVAVLRAMLAAPDDQARAHARFALDRLAEAGQDLT